jgi:hypothetical protein
MWYNEQDLAPYFLKHYSWADKIHLILDSDTNDLTLAEVSKYKNVTVEEFKFPDKMDDIIKANKFSEKYKKIDSDWVILVDADEFVFDKNLNNDIRPYLSGKNTKIIYVSLFNIYRHISESDLDINKTVMEQRRYGYRENLYTKPIVVKAGLEGCFWLPGNHSFVYDGFKFYYISPMPSTPYFKSIVEENDILLGSHWSMADQRIATIRRLQIKRRQSKVNLQNRFTSQHYHITAEQIESECKSNSTLPKLF